MQAAKTSKPATVAAVSRQDRLAPIEPGAGPGPESAGLRPWTDPDVCKRFPLGCAAPEQSPSRRSALASADAAHDFVADSLKAYLRKKPASMSGVGGRSINEFQNEFREAQSAHSCMASIPRRPRWVVTIGGDRREAAFLGECTKQVESDECHPEGQPHPDEPSIPVARRCRRRRILRQDELQVSCC